MAEGIIKTDSIEKKIDKFAKSIDAIEDLAEQETINIIEELLQMGTIRNWGVLIKMIFSSMKHQTQERLNKVNEVRQKVG